MTEINGHQLFGFFRAGARRLRAAEDELNRINVFPVPDGDTGTNMAVTMSYAVETAGSSESAADVLEALAEAALAGARGNSGVILAQFIAGLREGVEDLASLSLGHFVKAVDHACESARQAISDPQEGTILSVIRDWADALAAEYERSQSFTELFRAAAPALRASLASTREKLEVLKRADVVDAGASGFVAFIDGAHEYFEAGAPAFLPEEAELPPSLRSAARADAHEGAPVHRYCTEFLLAARGEALPRSGSAASGPNYLLDLEILRAELSRLGDSLIVAGGAKKARIHLHCDRPDLALELVAREGVVLEQKVDDMRRQYQDAHEGHPRVAIVTDSTCDLPPELLDRYRIHVLPLYLRFGEIEYLDRLTLDPRRFYELAESSPVFPKSSQPSSSQFERLFRSLLSHYDEVIDIQVSGKLSGSYEAGRRAAALVDPERITVFDSKQLSGSLGLLVLRAAELAESGSSAAEIRALLPDFSAKAWILVSVKTLAFMVRGGRVSPLKGALASFLNLKPIVSLDKDGASTLYGAAISRRRNLDKICSMVLAEHRLSPLRSYALVHAEDPQTAQDLAARLESLLGFPPLYTCPISAVVGMNAGKGAVAVVTMGE